LSYLPIEKTEVYAIACEVSDAIYGMVTRWPYLAQNTIGTQLIRAADSVGANLVEGDARRSDADSMRFFRYSRGSAREANHFVHRAAARGLISPEEATLMADRLKSCARMISGLLKHRESVQIQVREARIGYASEQIPADEEW
jgi:four helix bundle protein